VDERPTLVEMVDEALAAIGEDGVAALPGRAEALEADLVLRTSPGFEAFTALVADRVAP
jgi:hypothetical protein